MTPRQKVKSAEALRDRRIERALQHIERNMAQEGGWVQRAEQQIREAMATESELLLEVRELRGILQQRLDRLEDSQESGFRLQRHGLRWAWAALALVVLIPAIVEALSR